MFTAKLAIALISPLGMSLLVGLFALILSTLAWKRWALVLGCMALIWLWLWSLPLVSMWLRDHIERDFPDIAPLLLQKAEAIVVLGGGIQPPAHGELYPDLGAAADRVWHAARLYHAGKASLVILSGGSDANLRAMSEAQAMKLFMADLGVPQEAMVLEEKSRNTRQNAQFTSSLLSERQLESILLVTSALHMRRAMKLFRDQGLQVTAAATDHESRSLPAWQDWVPDAAALDGSARAMKEWVGFYVSRYRD